MHPEEWIGRILVRTYLIEHLLGTGGMGAVYRARQVRTGGEVAVKILRPEAAGEVEILRRFHSEAQVIAALRHPHIVQVIDFHEGDPEAHIDVPFLVMDLLEGEDLQSRLRRMRRLPYSQACKLALEVGSALQAAHNREIIHRDVKPQNLFIHRQAAVSGDGEIYKVVDFGISKIQSPSRRTPTLTVVGTPHYMAPEAAIGKSDDIDGRTDQFSLGIVLYKALSGYAPFDGNESIGVLYQVIHAEPEPLVRLVPDLPKHAIAAIERAMRKDKRDRFPSVLEFVQAFVGAARTGQPAWPGLPPNFPSVVETVRMPRSGPADLFPRGNGSQLLLPPSSHADLAPPTGLSLVPSGLEVLPEPSRMTPNSLSQSTGQTGPKQPVSPRKTAAIGVSIGVAAALSALAWLFITDSRREVRNHPIAAAPVKTGVAPPASPPAAAAPAIAPPALPAPTVPAQPTQPTQKPIVTPLLPEPTPEVSEPPTAISPPQKKKSKPACSIPETRCISVPNGPGRVASELRRLLRSEKVFLCPGEILTFVRNHRTQRFNYVLPIPGEIEREQFSALLGWLNDLSNVPPEVESIHVGCGEAVDSSGRSH